MEVRLELIDRDYGITDYGKDIGTIRRFLLPLFRADRAGHRQQ